MLFTLTRCKSIGFMIVPWKNSTVVKCRLNKPSNSKSGGFLFLYIIYRIFFSYRVKIIFFENVFHNIFAWRFFESLIALHKGLSVCKRDCLKLWLISDEIGINNFIFRERDSQSICMKKRKKKEIKFFINRLLINFFV